LIGSKIEARRRLVLVVGESLVEFQLTHVFFVLDHPPHVIGSVPLDYLSREVLPVFVALTLAFVLRLALGRADLRRLLQVPIILQTLPVVCF